MLLYNENTSVTDVMKMRFNLSECVSDSLIEVKAGTILRDDIHYVIMKNTRMPDCSILISLLQQQRNQIEDELLILILNEKDMRKQAVSLLKHDSFTYPILYLNGEIIHTSSRKLAQSTLWYKSEREYNANFVQYHINGYENNRYSTYFLDSKSVCIDDVPCVCSGFSITLESVGISCVHTFNASTVCMTVEYFIHVGDRVIPFDTRCVYNVSECDYDKGSNYVKDISHTDTTMTVSEMTMHSLYVLRRQ